MLTVIASAFWGVLLVGVVAIGAINIFCPTKNPDVQND